MQLPRFFDPLLPEQGVFELDPLEIRHVSSVLRCQPGDCVIVFDGAGREQVCRIVGISRKSVQLELVEALNTNRELPRSLTLAVALPKGDRQKTLIEMVTQIGVTHLLPLHTDRGVAQPTTDALLRLQRIVIEASKQCGRNRLMRILSPTEVRDLASIESMQNDQKWFAHPYDETGNPASALLEGAMRSKSISLAVGPEGGFTPDEIQALSHSGWLRVSLGKSIQRIETAAVTLAAWGVKVMLDQ